MFDDWWFGAVVVLIVGVVIAAIVLVASSSNHWAQHCHDQGGHTVNVDRKQVCLSADNVYMGHS